MTSPSPSEPRTRPLYHAVFAPASAAMIAAIAIGTIYAVQLVLAAVGTLDLVASAIGDLAVIAGLFAFARGQVGALGVRLPKARLVVAAVLVGVSLWYLDLRLILWLQPPGDTKPLEGLVTQSPLAPSILALAVLPAIAEELVFRGVLARGLASWSKPAAVIVSALVFSAYHMLPIQMVATLPLGLAFAYLALRADSALPSMLAHFLNNAIAILVSRDKLPAVGAWISDHPSEMLVGSAAVTVLGLALATKATA